MSDDPVLAALARMETAIGQLMSGQTALQAGQTALQADVTALQADVTALQRGQTALQADQTRLRVDLMDRMDRLQDAQTTMGHDMDTLLELLVTNQGIAERSVTDARTAMDIGARSSSILTKLLQRMRAVEDDVRTLKERGQEG